MKLLKKILYALAVLYVPLLLLSPFFIDQSSAWWRVPYAWTLLICLLITLPFYIAFLQVCSFVSRIADKKQTSRGEKILNIICDAVALSIFLTVIAFSKLFPITLGLSILLATLWAVRFAIFKRNFEPPEFFRQKSFWISAAALFIALVSVAAIYRFIVSADERRYDDVAVERAAADLSDFETIISEEHSLENFDLTRIILGIVDSPDHESSMVMMYSYGTESSTEIHWVRFDISYTDFLTLYNENDGYVVYNDTVEEIYDTLLTDISPEALFIVQKAIAREGDTLK